MEVGNYLLTHSFEFRVLFAILAIAGGFGLIKLYNFVAAARDAVLEKYRAVAEANGKDATTGTTLLRRHALGNS